MSFVARGRLENDTLPEGFSPIPPDLAIEVLSPEDRRRDVLDKIGECLDAGVTPVWVLDPATRRATVYRSSSDVRTLEPGDELDGESIVPGFRCRVADLFE